jgi:YVTN family beta-propeller protein
LAPVHIWKWIILCLLSSFTFVANQNSDNVSVVEIHTNAVVDTIAIGPSPGEVAITPDGKLVYVANPAASSPSASDNVTVIDTATNTVVNTVPVGSSSSGVVMTPMQP